MKNIALLISLILLSCSVAAEELTAKEIMIKVDERVIPQDMRLEMKMNLINKLGQIRQRKVITLRRGDEKQIMWFLEPADIKGTSFLRIEHSDDTEDMWLYLPAFKKIRRIVSSARKENFMGSDFTYEDMSTRKLDDYTYKRLEDEMISSYNCYVVESIPTKDADISYSKIISWIWQDDLLPIKEEYYDRLGYLKKVKLLTDIRKIGKYWQPHQMSMEDVQKKHSTELIFKNITVALGLPDKLFHTRYLTRKAPR